MRLTLAAIIVLILTCSACDSMQKGFSEDFDKSFKEGCRNGALKNGASQQVADKYCECALAKYKETKSMDEAAKACVAQLKSGASQQNAPSQ